MSKGHGRVQRAILDALTPGGAAMMVWQLTLTIFSEQAHDSGSPAKSVRRALRALYREGLVGRDEWWRWYLVRDFEQAHAED